jgi:acetolactate synthase-1/3 small subunit
MTVVVCGDEGIVDQVFKQLEKLVEVVAVQILPPEAAVRRGMAMIKVAAGEKRGEVIKLADVFRAAVVDVSENTVTLEVTGDDEKINALAEVLVPYGILEIVRTGLIGLIRGEETIHLNERSNFYEQIVL